jgi:hypothetical protein
MKAATKDEARKWCSQEAVGLRFTREGLLTYGRTAKHKFFITAPEEHREILVLARHILLFRGEADFNGGLFWLQRWSIGSPQLVRVGWRILEDIRRAHGELRSLETAPAQFFREDGVNRKISQSVLAVPSSVICKGPGLEPTPAQVFGCPKRRTKLR